MQNKISSGAEAVDGLLEGGYEKDVITTVYGPAGSGKTCLCILAAIGVCREAKKVIYIDTEGGFSVDRMMQLADDYKELLQNMMFFKPTSFNEQMNVFEKLKEAVKENIGLIIVDSIAMLYRLELGKSEEVYKVNRELGEQIAYLTEIARKKNIPVLITNQVYANFDDKDKVNMVGGDILKYGSKCLVELQIALPNKRKAVLKKHRSIQQENEIEFLIKEKGFEKVIKK